MTAGKRKAWFHGLIAAIISGAASGGATALSAVLNGDEHATQVGALLRLAALPILVGAGIGAFMYLQKSPLPE